MKIIHHKGLTKQQWHAKNIFEQMANIGSEVERSIKWRGKNKRDFQLALERCLELIDLTVSDPKNRYRLTEILRTRELLVDYLLGQNEYFSTDKLWQNYFYNFNYAARLKI